MEKKYKLTDETINIDGTILYRIEALKDFSDVKKGEKGGFVQSENNLSHNGTCWVYDDAIVYDDATVYGNAKIYYNAKVYGNAIIYDNSYIFGNVEVFGNAEIYNNARICNNTKVYGYTEICGSTIILGDADIKNNSDYITFKNWWSSGRYFTWTRSNNMWTVDCFYGTGKELIEKAYNDSELSGREYERIVYYVESLLKENKIKKSSKIVKYFRRNCMLIYNKIIKNKYINNGFN